MEFLTLPDEIIEKIVSHTNLYSLRRLRKCNKFLYELTKEPLRNRIHNLVANQFGFYDEGDFYYYDSLKNKYIFDGSIYYGVPDYFIVDGQIGVEYLKWKGTLLLKQRQDIETINKFASNKGTKIVKYFPFTITDDHYILLDNRELYYWCSLGISGIGYFRILSFKQNDFIRLEKNVVDIISICRNELVYLTTENEIRKYEFDIGSIDFDECWMDCDVEKLFITKQLWKDTNGYAYLKKDGSLRYHPSEENYKEVIYEKDANSFVGIIKSSGHIQWNQRTLEDKGGFIKFLGPNLILNEDNNIYEFRNGKLSLRNNFFGFLEKKE